MNQTTHFTVIGAGHGGKAMAAHLALMDFPVTLYNRTPDHISAIKELWRYRPGRLRRRAAAGLASWRA